VVVWGVVEFSTFALCLHWNCYINKKKTNTALLREVQENIAVRAHKPRQQGQLRGVPQPVICVELHPLESGIVMWPPWHAAQQSWQEERSPERVKF